MKIKSKDLLKISVIIVAGQNRKKELFRCIESVKNSSYKNFEVLVIDNSCNDNLYKELKLNYPFIRFYRMPINTGIFGYNFGFANASGEIIMVLDDDSEVKKNTLEKVVQYFSKKSKELAVVSLNIYNPLSKSYSYQHFLINKSLEIPTFCGGGCAFRKEVLKKIGYYDHDFFCWVHEDDLALKILDKGYKIHFVREIEINHYEQQSIFRKEKAFITFRNKAWLNLKHFSVWAIPLLVIRDLIWIPFYFRRNHIKASFYGLSGYLLGYLSSFSIIKKRQTVSFSIQKKYLTSYILGKHLSKVKKYG